MGSRPEESSIEKFPASDGYVWNYRHYPAQGTPRGQIVALHGIQSHGGWYSGSCSQLAREGWEVFFLDRRGSGLNTQARGDAPTYRRLLTDIDEFISAKCSRHPFLMAISWGGKLALGLEHFYPGACAGLILLTPGICPRIHPSLFTRLRIALTRLVLPGRRFAIPLDDPLLFTNTPRWQEFLSQDPLALHLATARFLVESRRLDILMKRAFKNIRLPILLLLAGKDRIISNKATRDYAARFPTQDCTIKEYPEAAHTLEFEADPEPIFRDVLEWLEARSSSTEKVL
ncbi:MAG: alpha/beta fold hydrolase [Gemmataceae bacterium]